MAQSLEYQLDIAKESRWVFHTASYGARNSLLFVQEAGEFFAEPGYYTTREGFDSYLLKLTVSGCGMLDYGGRQYSVPPRHFFWIDCQNRQDYRTDPDAGNWRVLWVHFYGGAARFSMRAFSTRPEESRWAASGAVPASMRRCGRFWSFTTGIRRRQKKICSPRCF